ncbi:hypothetical protein KC367_g116 [Hortaea werneckii]|nr:hypothetical protein KC367_g116 [Hortaea werneckii]
MAWISSFLAICVFDTYSLKELSRIGSCMATVCCMSFALPSAGAKNRRIWIGSRVAGLVLPVGRVAYAKDGQWDRIGRQLRIELLHLHGDRSAAQMDSQFLLLSLRLAHGRVNLVPLAQMHILLRRNPGGFVNAISMRQYQHRPTRAPSEEAAGHMVANESVVTGTTNFSDDHVVRTIPEVVHGIADTNFVGVRQTRKIHERYAML